MNASDPTTVAASSCKYEQEFRSMLMEGAICGVVGYWFLMQGAARILMPKLMQLTKVEGLFRDKPSGAHGDMYHETIAFGAVALAHGFAGSMIAYGAFTGQMDFVRSGLIFEWGFQIVDGLQALFRSGILEHITDNWRTSLFHHHASGILTGVPIVLFHLYDNLYVQVITVNLMLISGAGLIVIIVSKNISKTKGFLSLAAVLDAIEFLFCTIFCRIVVFPICGVLLARDLFYQSHIMVAAMVLGGVMGMSSFNLKFVMMRLGKFFDKQVVDKEEEIEEEEEEKEEDMKVNIVRKHASRRLPFDDKRRMHRRINMLKMHTSSQ